MDLAPTRGRPPLAPPASPPHSAAMPCLLAIVALAAPRLVIAVLWFFTDWFRGLFDTPLWPVLGFVFLPTSFLWFTAVQRWFGGQWTLWPVVGLVAALMIDLSPAGGRRARKS